MAKKKDSNTFEIILISILVIIIVALVTLAVHYERQLFLCANNPSPYCYKDWECPDETDPNKKNPWQGLANQGLVSSDPTKGACYIQPNGVQSNCPNAWQFLQGNPVRPSGPPAFGPNS